MLHIVEKLRQIRMRCGPRRTIGLREDVIERLAEGHPDLVAAIDRAIEAHREIRETSPELVSRDEDSLVEDLLADYVNFYAPDAVNPYVALAAQGPWVITAHGAVLHDNGGYGMLGMGHAPAAVLEVLAAPYVMANVMTASHHQLRFADRLRREIGHTRGGSPFARFFCLNSVSESVTLAARIADANAKIQTDPGGAHAGKRIRRLALVGGFHGRTDPPARFSDSTWPSYHRALASFRTRDELLLVAPNDVEGVEAIFDGAAANGEFIEAAFIEPVMGEGNPGLAITRAFYDALRRRTKEQGGLLVVDSIQAGLRAHGVLSIVDYPGFQDAEAPDLETYSKALNAGQYPLSVVAATERAAGYYVRGTYGNTMTTSPRPLAVACAVLDAITPELRQNIRDRGVELRQKLAAIAERHPDIPMGAQGTGLLVSLALDTKVPVIGPDGLETWCRRHGIGVIHGGHNALRFTPHFAITSEEIDLIVETVERGIVAVAAATAERSAIEASLTSLEEAEAVSGSL